MAPTAAAAAPALVNGTADSATAANSTPNLANSPTKSKLPAGDPTTEQLSRNAADANGKRKRLNNNVPSNPPQPAGRDDQGKVDPAVKVDIVNTVMKNMLAVLEQHDTTPSILHFELSESKLGDSRPSKRVRHNHDSKHRPSTIAQRLSQGSYTDLAPLLEDISAVASAIAHAVRLEAERREEPPSNAPTPRDGSQDELPLVLAKVLIFQQTAHNLAMVEQSRRSGVFELEIPPAPQLALTQKVCLTVMSQNGPLFSSLQKPTTIPASTSPSTVSTPAPSPSTAPTSLQSSPLKSKVVISEVAVVQPIPESTLPVSISTTKAHSLITSATKNPPVKTIGETFPAPAYLRPIGPPPKGGTQYKGLTWGGKRAGGPPPEMIHETQTRTGSWLSYKNDALSPRGKGGAGLLMGANALPAEFVAAYTSFAPTRDDSFASVPSSVKQMVWWMKLGKEKFSRLFPEFEKLGSFNRIEEVFEEDTAMDVDDKEEMVNEEEEFRKAVEAFQPAEVPIDFRLLNDDWKSEPDFTSDTASFNSEVEQRLERISSLLESLYKQQHIRLAAPPPPPPPTKASKSPSVASPTATPVVGTPNQPNELEIMLYNNTVKELTKLISQLPPHLVANIHGDKDGELALSSMIPLTNGKEVWKGTLPSVGARQAMNGYPSQSPLLSHPTLQAMSTATGMPINGAPQAPMMNVRMQQQPSQQYHLPPQHQTPARGPVNVPAPPPPQQYHTARMPQQGIAGGYGHPQQVMTPQPQQAQYQNYHRHAAPAPNQAPMQQPQAHYPPPYIATAPMQQGGAVPTTPQPSARVISPMTPAAIPTQPYQQAPTAQPQPQLYHSHSYPGQHQQQPVQTPQRTAQAPQGTPHYMQGIQPPPPRVIGPVNAPAHHQQLQPQPQTYHQHHIPPPPAQQPQVPQQPVYHQHTIPQPATPQPQYHHHHHVIRNSYPQQGVPQQPPPQQQGISPMMGYQQIPAQQQQQQQMQYQQQPQVQYAQRGVNVPAPQGLGAVGYGPPVPHVQQVPVPQMQGMPGTPTPVRYASRK
ncbi:hypothetical protein L211DRAFT_847923 [Terfezia boudieri ATCC MYA-4762]|uniref:Uncharacterized protein n=1 Tax=Terfezia boudieri ATCC MYA-4762 TaxID=1051890 RepID=A0A3N4LY31_9PEZI|nr:hypothetical protein L211DRAFT_847923 [Terfezia boudieri ATCC MYA-4762]